MRQVLSIATTLPISESVSLLEEEGVMETSVLVEETEGSFLTGLMAKQVAMNSLSRLRSQP